MEWWLILLMIFGGFVLLMSIGMPVAFAFTVVNLIGALIFWQGDVGQLVMSVYDSVANFAFLPVPLFVLMGEIMFQSGIAARMLDVLDTWMGRLRGRLSLLAVTAGVIFATMTGSSTAGVAMLGSLLVPDMEKRGYHKTMTLGPIMASGGLATMIPPTALGVLLASLTRISIGKFLIAIIIPGLIMATMYAAYILIRCRINPDLAPAYEVERVPLSERLILTLRYVLPLGFIIFLVIGLMFLGVASPTEAAALGTVGCFILAAVYGALKWTTVVKSFEGTMKITFMIFMILTGSTAFAQMLAYTGATSGLVQLVSTADIHPLFIVVLMQAVMLLMGCFMEALSILMVTMPIFMPVIQTLGLDPMWFAVIALINMETSVITPPFGLSLFVMKGVAPKGTTLGEVYRSAVPFVLLNVLAIIIIFLLPGTVSWLPGLMK